MSESRVAKRDWKRWGLSYVGHWLTGGVLGFGATTGFVGASMGGLGLVVAYQLGEYWKYGDTVALDLKDYGVGYAVGVGAGVLWRYL